MTNRKKKASEARETGWLLGLPPVLELEQARRVAMALFAGDQSLLDRDPKTPIELEAHNEALAFVAQLPMRRWDQMIRALTTDPTPLGVLLGEEPPTTWVLRDQLRDAWHSRNELPSAQISEPDDAALLVSRYQVNRRQPVAENPPASSKVSPRRMWRPLHVSIAWGLTRDEQFCADVAENASAAQRIFCASLQLEHEMIEAGCFNVVNEIMQLDPPTRTVEFQTHRLVPGYSGRYRAVAEDYELRGRRDYTDSIAQLPHAPESERNRVSLGDYLQGRWAESFCEIMAHVSDGAISARGVALDGNVRKPAGEMPASSVTDSMWMDVDGVVWEGPQSAIFFDEKPRQWIDISLNWDELLVCFPAHDSDAVQPKFANETDASLLQPSSSSKRGRRPHSYWDAVKPIVMKKLDDDGLPDAQSGDPRWSGQADLERYIADEVAKRLSSEQSQPAESTVREWAVKWTDEFRSARLAEDR